MQTRRIYTLDVFKLLLAYEIAIYHFGIELPPTPGVAVDVFFILSGFYLARKYVHRKGSDDSALKYTLEHAKGIYPHYLFSLGVFFLYQLARNLVYLVLEPSMSSLWNLGAYFYDQVPDLLFLQSSHYFEKGLLYPTWQISAMLIAGYFVYALLLQKEQLSITVIFPASILMVQSLMYAGADYFDNYGFFYLPLLRGFSAMGLGVMTYFFAETETCQNLFAHKKAANICGIAALTGILIYGDRGRIYLILVPFLLLLCNQDYCIFHPILNRKIFRNCAKLSLAIYLNHSFIIRICETQLQPRLDFSTVGMLPIYLVLLTGYSLVTLKLVSLIQKRIHKQ